MTKIPQKGHRNDPVPGLGPIYVADYELIRQIRFSGLAGRFGRAKESIIMVGHLSGVSCEQMWIATAPSFLKGYRRMAAPTIVAAYHGHYPSGGVTVFDDQWEIRYHPLFEEIAATFSKTLLQT